MKSASAPPIPPSLDRNAWFKEARFGLFVHWGLYSVQGRGEWALNRERVPLADYTRLARRFTADRFDPMAWAKLARRAGMKYVVLTTKHHEGFCLWDSKTCSFNATRSAARRDLLAEYVEAVRSEGLKVGLYYSLGDWHHPDWTLGWQGNNAARRRFSEYTFQLIEELMTGYGPIDVLWYDLPQGFSADEWRSVELNTRVRALQPQILINNRALTTEDFTTPEQHVAAARRGRLWEACMTLNDSWGYRGADQNWKSPTAVAKHLLSVAAGGGNLLLNVGPDGRGQIPSKSIAILEHVGRWLQRSGEAVFNVERHDLPWLLCGAATVKGRSIYLGLFPYEGPATTLGGLIGKIRKVSLLSTGQPIAFVQKGAQTRLHGLPTRTPDSVLPVVKIELDRPPDLDVSRVIGGADIFAELPK